MRAKQLIILLVLAAALAVAIWFKRSGDTSEIGNTSFDDVLGRSMLKEFDPNSVGSFTLKNSTGEITVEKKNNKWVLPAKGDFPVKYKGVTELLLNIYALKISEGVELGAESMGNQQLLKPGEADKPEKAGTLVTLKGMDGSVISTMVLGKVIDFDSKSQWIKVDGEPLAWKIKAGITQVDTTAANWFDSDQFIKLESTETGDSAVGIGPNKIKSVAATGPSPEETWKIFRDGPEGDAANAKLDAPQAGEDFDPNKGTGALSVLAWSEYGTLFADVAPESDREKSGVGKPSRTVVIDTFDGFSYTLNLGNESTAPEGRYATFTCDFKLPDQRTAPPPKEDGKPAETEEEKKANDQKYTDLLAKRKEKFEKQKALKDRIYILSKSNVETLLKKRKDFMKDKTPEPGANTPGASGANPGIPSLPSITPPGPSASIPAAPPKTGATAVTPAIEVRPDGTTRVVSEEEMKRGAPDKSEPINPRPKPPEGKDKKAAPDKKPGETPAAEGDKKPAGEKKEEPKKEEPKKEDKPGN